MLDVKERIVESAAIDDLIVNLVDIPDKLLEARTERAHLATAIREAEESLAMASLPLEFDAFSNGKNDAERKAKLKTLQAADKVYRAAKRRLTGLENELTGLDLEVRHQEDKFAALHSIAKLEAARLGFLTEE